MLTVALPGETAAVRRETVMFGETAVCEETALLGKTVIHGKIEAVCKKVVMSEKSTVVCRKAASPGKKATVFGETEVISEITAVSEKSMVVCRKAASPGRKAIVFGKTAAAVLCLLLCLSSCAAETSENITLPAPVTSRTTVSLPPIDLNPPPISVIVPPVTAPPETTTPSVATSATTTADPLASIPRVPLSAYLGYESETETSAETASASASVPPNVAIEDESTAAATTTAATVAVADYSYYTSRYPEREIYRPYEYGFLTEAQKALYVLLEDTFMSVSNELTVPADVNVTSADFDKVFTIFLNKDPHTYYFLPTATPRYDKTTDKLFGVTLGYLYPKATITSRNERTDTALREARSGITAFMSDYDKVIYFYNYLAAHITYDGTTDDSDNIYGALTAGRAACMGYSYAMKMLCNAEGIETITVSGENSGGIKHMWNMVKLDGEWYQLDATFGDRDGGYVYYDYCLTTDARLYKSYTAAKTDIAYPKAVSMEDNYYVKNNLFATTREEAVSILQDELMKAAQSKQTTVQILCATQNVFENTQNALILPESTDNIINLVTVINEMTGANINIGRTSYHMGDISNVIKILLVYN
jgi:hypothetical protein